MHAQLQTLCDQFILNRDAVRASEKMADQMMTAVCAYLFTAKGIPADAAGIAACKNLVKSRLKWHSTLRGNVMLLLSCILSMEEDPARALTRVEETYTAFRAHFTAYDHLALAAILLRNEQNPDSLAARARELYQGMRRQHPFLTGQEDAFYCLLLCRTNRDENALMAAAEAAYAHLTERFAKADWTQTVSHMVALQDEKPECACQKLFDLFDAITLAGGKFGRSWELPALCALALAAPDARICAHQVMDADRFLSTQKGYGFFGFGKKDRLMHAAMIASCLYGTEGMDSAGLLSTLCIIIARRAAATAAAV